MRQTEPTAVPDAALEPTSHRDPAELMRSLREAGKHAGDPVAFHYLETLASRVQTHQGRVQQMLYDKLVAATHAFMERERAVQCEPGSSPTMPGQESLRGLVESLSRHGSTADAKSHTADTAAQPELKSIAYFRSTWSKLSTDKQMAHAFAQAPKNAGPLNSHVVVLRSLALMRDISPDYLNRFVSYVDTLARLDQSANAIGVSRKSVTGTGVRLKKNAHR